MNNVFEEDLDLEFELVELIEADEFENHYTNIDVRDMFDEDEIEYLLSLVKED